MSIGKTKPQAAEVRVIGLLYVWRNHNKESVSALTLHLSEQQALQTMCTYIEAEAHTVASESALGKALQGDDFEAIADAWNEYTQHGQNFILYRTALILD